MVKLSAVLSKHPGFRAARYELGLYRDLLAWGRGKVRLPQNATAFAHPPGRLQMLGFLTMVMLTELVVLHLLLPEGVMRLIALVVSIWGLVFVWGLIASERVRPSYIDRDRVILRRGRKTFAKIPRTVITQALPHRGYSTDIVVEGGELTVGGAAGTDTVLVLREPVEVSEDTYPWQKTRTQPVTRVRFYSGDCQCLFPMMK